MAEVIALEFAAAFIKGGPVLDMASTSSGMTVASRFAAEISAGAAAAATAVRGLATPSKDTPAALLGRVAARAPTATPGAMVSTTEACHASAAVHDPAAPPGAMLDAAGAS